MSKKGLLNSSYWDRKFRPRDWAESLIHWPSLQRPLPKRGPTGPRDLLLSWWAEIIWLVGSICQSPCRQLAHRKGKVKARKFPWSQPPPLWPLCSDILLGAWSSLDLIVHGVWGAWPWWETFHLTDPSPLSVCGGWDSSSCNKPGLPSIHFPCREAPASVCGSCCGLRRAYVCSLSRVCLGTASLATWDCLGDHLKTIGNLIWSWFLMDKQWHPTV